MAQATSYNTTGVREDLTDMLTILEPETTPILSSLNKMTKPGQPYSEWQADTLKAPNFSGIIEGVDVDNFEHKSANRGRFGNYIQKFRETWAVSDIEEITDTAGVDNEVANAKAKSLQEIKRSIEAAICSDNDMQADTGVAPYLTRGLGKWIQATAQTVNPVPTLFLTPSGNINTTATASFTEVSLTGVLQSVYENTGDIGSYKLYAGTNLKKGISNFTRAEGATTAKVYTVTESATSHAVTLTVDFYNSDWGTVEIIPTLFNGLLNGEAPGSTAQCKARGYLMNDNLVGLKTMKALGSQELPNEGGGRRGYVDTVLMLVVKNPKGLGKFSASS